MSALAGMTVHTSAGDVELVPEETAPPPPPAPAGVRWYLKSWFELGKTLAEGSPSNFCALGLFDAAVNGTSGQNTWVRCDAEEIELVCRVNWNMALGSDLWHYLVAPQSRIYRTIGGQDPDIPGASINWPRIVIGSKGPGERNEVMVVEGDPETDPLVRIAGIPHSVDYAAYSPETHPYFFCRDYCMYGNTVIGDSAKGVVLWMPIFDAADPGYYIGNSKPGLWIPSVFLHSRVGVAPAPHPAIVHELLTVPGSRVLVCHLYRFDLPRVVPFVTPKLGYKLTPHQAVSQFHADLAINGDQGPWLAMLLARLLPGLLVSTGRWMSRGTWLSQSTAEASAWFDKAGGCWLSGPKPAGITPYNVISGPKLMISGGVPVKPVYDDSFIAARSAFGLYDATRALVLAIEGQEGSGEGATEEDLLVLGLAQGLRALLEFDSGGSTSVEQLNGVSYSVEQRAVLNCLCFAGK